MRRKTICRDAGRKLLYNLTGAGGRPSAYYDKEGRGSRINVKFADLAHLVERDLAKVEVAGSGPVIRSSISAL